MTTIDPPRQEQMQILKDEENVVIIPPPVKQPDICEIEDSLLMDGQIVSFKTNACVFWHNTKVDAELALFGIKRCTPSTQGVSALPNVCSSCSHIITGLKSCNIVFSDFYKAMNCVDVSIDTSIQIPRLVSDNTIMGGASMTTGMAIVPQISLTRLYDIFNFNTGNVTFTPHFRALWNNLRALNSETLNLSTCATATLLAADNKIATKTASIIFATQIIAYCSWWYKIDSSTVINSLKGNTWYDRTIDNIVRELYTRMTPFTNQVLRDYFGEEVLLEDNIERVRLAPIIDNNGFIISKIPVMPGTTIILSGKQEQIKKLKTDTSAPVMMRVNTKCVNFRPPISSIGMGSINVSLG